LIGGEGCAPVLLEALLIFSNVDEDSRTTESLEVCEECIGETGKLIRHLLNKFILSKSLKRNFNSFMSILHTTNLSVHLSDVIISLCTILQSIMFFPCRQMKVA